jgi:hypothetical protein
MRYKSVYGSHITIVDAWVKGRLSPKGDFFKSSTIMCDHKSIYSYGRHFCMAKKIDENTVLLTERKYSVSTAKHRNLVASALRCLNYNVIPVPTLDQGGPKEWVEFSIKAACGLFQDAKKARANRPFKTGYSVEYFNRAARYAEEFGVEMPTPAALPQGYLDFLVVEMFKQKVDQTSTPIPTLHPCYTAHNGAVAV